ncbi:hypothetical protein BZARG_3058 [Bizionia argentinensis JUB59]|uniref:Heavy metal-binding domain-containing protein n=1 Tax=Bizionia argentinensis JUB59 TaxID=1046627 RepID=G2EGG1_9FLAO|nr:DUF6567 family protein [Bizionia argentinensis]EGV42472.2 hypothetical protein BZARG_3058 [Bizionia argentinensis JUB59]
MVACRTSLHHGRFNQLNQLNQTQTVLSSNNFAVLGNFKGIATQKIVTGNITNKEGIISRAKAKLHENAREAGIELTGCRTLVNISVDIIETEKRISATISTEIIEFR